MIFSYTPITEQEALQERFQLLKEGEYDAVIKTASDSLSSTGNPMMDIMVNVYDINGRISQVRDFLVFTKPTMWKVINFSKSCGVLDDYLQGKLCSQIIINKSVRVKIIIEKGNEIPFDKLKGKLVGSKYPDKNRIEDYIETKNSSTYDDNDNPDINRFNDDIPFF